jgi:hypothetical protein
MDIMLTNPQLSFVDGTRASKIVRSGYGWPKSCISCIKPVAEIIDPVFTKTSQNARFLLSENERFGLVFVKTGSINSGTGRLIGYLFSAKSEVCCPSGGGA